MTSYGKTVLWLGMLLIAMNLVRNWSQIRSMIFTTNSASQDQTNGQQSSSQTPFGIIHIPGLGNFMPGGLGGLFPLTSASNGGTGGNTAVD